MPYCNAMLRCDWPSTRNMAQSSRWRLAKSRELMPTATAANNAASKATKFKNFSARSSVWRISGRPASSDSTRTPRSVWVLICASAQVVKAAAAVSRPDMSATAKR